jgi:hypothetical protein
MELVILAGGLAHGRRMPVPVGRDSLRVGIMTPLEVFPAETAVPDVPYATPFYQRLARTKWRGLPVFVWEGIRGEAAMDAVRRLP